VQARAARRGARARSIRARCASRCRSARRVRASRGDATRTAPP
jgi:hypothetical protein